MLLLNVWANVFIEMKGKMLCANFTVLKSLVGGVTANY